MHVCIFFKMHLCVCVCECMSCVCALSFAYLVLLKVILFALLKGLLGNMFFCSLGFLINIQAY